MDPASVRILGHEDAGRGDETMHDRLRSHSSPAPAQGQGRRLELRQAPPRRRAHTTLCLHVVYGASTPFADAAAAARALHLFRAGIGLPAPALSDAGSAVTAIWRLAAGSSPGSCRSSAAPEREEHESAGAPREPRRRRPETEEE
jgi:hypothetical protein